MKRIERKGMFNYYNVDGRDDANFCVSAYLKHNGWDNNFVIGTLPNGDYVAVLERK